MYSCTKLVSRKYNSGTRLLKSLFVTVAATALVDARTYTYAGVHMCDSARSFTIVQSWLLRHESSIYVRYTTPQIDMLCSVDNKYNVIEEN